MLLQSWWPPDVPGAGVSIRISRVDRTNYNPASRSRRFKTQSSHYINLVPLLGIRRLAGSARGWTALLPFYTQLQTLGRNYPSHTKRLWVRFSSLSEVGRLARLKEQLYLVRYLWFP